MTLITAMVFFQMFQIGFMTSMLVTILLDLRRDRKKKAYDKLVADVAKKVKEQA